jgi:MFS family permease
MKIPHRVVLVSLIVGSCLFGDSLLYSVLPANVPSFSLKVAFVGVILSANRYIRLVSNSWAAWVYDRVGLRGPLALAVLGTVISTATYGLSKGLWPLLLARILWGICFSFLRLGGLLTVLDESTDRNRGMLIGVFNSIWRTGSLIGVVLGSILTDVIGHQTTFILFAAASSFGLLLVPLVAGARVSTPLPIPNERAQEPLEPVTANAVGRNWRRLFWRLTVADLPVESHHVRLPLLIVGLTKFANGFAAQGLVGATLGFYLRSHIGDETQFIGITLGVTTITGLLLGGRFLTDLTAILLGHMSDRLGRHILVYIASPASIALLFLLAYSPLPAIPIAALPLLFLAGTAVSVTLDASVGDLAPRERRAQVLGRYTTWADLGSASGPLLGFAAVSAVGLSALYAGAAAVLIVTLAIYTYAMTRSKVRVDWSDDQN